MSTKTCKNCSVRFTWPYRLGLKLWNARQFCTRLCSDIARKGILKSPRTRIVCKTCSLEFAVTPHRIEATYCSRLCQNRDKKGQTAPNWKGGGPQCIDCPATLINRNADRCRACSDKFRSGSNNPAWKGGVTPLNRCIRTSAAYQNWRKQVFERDDYTCQACGEKGGRLNADHELPFAHFPDLRFEVLNGRTLCEECHKQTPTYGNRRNPQLV